MQTNFTHLSVLAKRAPRELVTNPDGIYVDATFGRGGHSREILQLLSPKGRLIAFDRDPQAVESAQAISDTRFCIVHAPFSEMKERLADLGISEVAGIFMDIGVSSPQIDDAARGFSFRNDGPLDMRMDTTSGVTAAEWINEAQERDIARVIDLYGEERYARKIARAIVTEREKSPIVTTKQLAAIVVSCMPVNKKDPTQNPATRTFQAIRIHINAELEELQKALSAAMDLSQNGARIAVITFHSLEDRIVKRFFDDKAHPERAFDARLPLRADQLPPPELVDICRILPDEAECDANPRARSAILRVATRVRKGGQ